MGDWQFPRHYSLEAKDFARAHRALQVSHFAEKVLPSLRSTATSVGYTLATHGSLIRDLDLIAVPWRDDACDPDKLISMLCDTTKRSTGWGHLSGEKTEKPWGRVAVTILGTSEVHIDLSIMPRSTPAKDIVAEKGESA